MGSWNCASCTFANTSDSGEAVCTKCHAKRVPSCAKCHAEMRSGPRLNVNGQSYHKDCFTCTGCNKPFPTNTFKLKDGKPFHEECLQIPVVICFGCKNQIRSGSRLNVNGQTYHPDCFVCAGCKKPFPSGQFKIKDGKFFHDECLQIPVVTCAGCHAQMRSGARLNVNGQTYHPDCFTCAGCKKPFPTNKFMIKDSKPYHSECLSGEKRPASAPTGTKAIAAAAAKTPAKPQTTCGKCHKDLGTQGHVTVDGTNYHPDCFVCTGCHKPFDGRFEIQDGKPFHDQCRQLPECPACHKDIRGKRLNVNGQAFHPDCFTCKACDKKLDAAKFRVKDGERYHANCYRDLFHPHCDLCGDFVPFIPGTERIDFKTMDFWNLRFCPSHEHRDRCGSCQRLEPVGVDYETLSDGRKICKECNVYLLHDKEQIHSVTVEVWDFMESVGISLPQIPVYLVDTHTLKENRGAKPGADKTDPCKKPTGEGHITRGLCLSEISKMRHVVQHGKDPHNQEVTVKTNRAVNAILILHGLPYDLTASVLAHECTHAHIKLSDNYPKLPKKIEEGVCQLMSYLWLKYKSAIVKASSEPHPKFTQRLREFYMEQLENDPSPDYGDGFREALDAYHRTKSLQKVFDHIRKHADFP